MGEQPEIAREEISEALPVKADERANTLPDVRPDVSGQTLSPAAEPVATTTNASVADQLER